MNTFTRHAAGLLILMGILGSASLCFADTDPRITRVERNLLPYHIIDGQPSYRLQDRMAHYRVPGVSLAVIEDFEIQWVAHYGMRAAAEGQPVDGSTLFNVGSLSKAMASAMILTLVEQGLVDLHSDVNPQLTSWQIPANEFTALTPVTPLQLMNHSGGMPHRPPFSYTADQMPTTLQMIDGLPPSRSTPLQVVQEPGTGFIYSNGGFTVLQILAEDVTGLPFDEAARQLVFTPLALEQTTFTTPLPASEMARAATGHNRTGDTYADPPVWMSHTAAGGLWTTAEDYAHFVVELQKSVHGKSNRLFSPELTDQMLSPHASTQYGLGVFLYEGTGAESYFSHIGDGPGFVGGFTAHRTGGFGVVVLTNGQGGINLVREILRSVAQVYDWPGYLQPSRPELALSDAELTRFQGRYRTGLDTTVSLAESGGFLTLDAAGVPGFRLFRVARDTFVCQERRGELVLGTDPGTRMTCIDYRLSDDIGRLGDEEQRYEVMAPGESTPLEKLLAGRVEEARREYLAFQAAHPDHADVRESRFNRLGYQLLRQEDIEGALAVFELNTVLHPGSGNVYDSFGEGLLAAERHEAAVAAYRKSVALDPDNANAAKVLQELESR